MFADLWLYCLIIKQTYRNQESIFFVQVLNGIRVKINNEYLSF